MVILRDFFKIFSLYSKTLISVLVKVEGVAKKINYILYLYIIFLIHFYEIKLIKIKYITMK